MGAYGIGTFGADAEEDLEREVIAFEIAPAQVSVGPGVAGAAASLGQAQDMRL